MSKYGLIQISYFTDAELNHFSFTCHNSDNFAKEIIELVDNDLKVYQMNKPKFIDKNGYGISIRYTYKNEGKYLLTIYQKVLTYILNIGWEPFSQDSHSYFFKLKLE